MYFNSWPNYIKLKTYIYSIKTLIFIYLLKKCFFKYIYACFVAVIIIIFFLDLAVGAPYEEDGGAVYIYLGSRDGLITTPSQVSIQFQFQWIIK